MDFSKLFGSQSAEKVLHIIAEELQTLRKLYELELRSKGLTFQTSEEIGEILETDPETLALQERMAHVRKQLGLPPEYPLGAALPTGEDGFGPTQEEVEAEPDGFQGYDSVWGTGPEGAEAPPPGDDPNGGTRGGPPPAV